MNKDTLELILIESVQNCINEKVKTNQLDNSYEIEKVIINKISGITFIAKNGQSFRIILRELNLIILE